MSFGKDIFCRGIDLYNMKDTGDTVSTIATNVGCPSAIGPKVAIMNLKSFRERLNLEGNEVCGTIDANIFVKNNNQDNTKYIIEKKARMTMEEAISDINKTAPHQQDQLNYDKEAARTLAAGTHGAASHLTKTVCENDDVCIVRRLTTVECSRLMGFPDDYLKPMGGDSSQYRGAGNSWAVNCARFIMSRIHIVSNMDSMKYATVCSGVEAHSLAVHDFGDKAVFFSEIEKPQCQLLKEHYSNVPNFGDFTKIHLDDSMGVLTNSLRDGDEDDLPQSFYHAPTIQVSFKRGELDILSGGIPCFTKGTMVLTEKGYIPIEDIKPGDNVVTHLGRLKGVVKVGRMKSDNIVEVSIASRPPIRMTVDHKFWAADRIHHNHANNLVIDSCGFREILDIGRGGYVAQNREYHIPMPKIPKIYSASEFDVIEIAGWYVGDGYIRDQKGTKKKSVCLCLNDKKLSTFVERFSGKVNFCLSKERTATKVIIYSTEFARWLENNFGRLSYKKTVPAWLIGANQEIKDAFISGCLLTDGYIDHRQNDMRRFSTVSKSLAYGIADIIGRACVSVSNRKPTTEIEGRTVNQRASWSIHASKNANRFHRFGQWDLVCVHKIKKCESDIVYQIMVDGDHSYISNGLCSKNCTDVSVAGKREGMKEGSGTRSSLAFNYQKLIDDIEPKFVVYENVPGIFSSNGGKDFIWFISKIMNSGYTIAWRVLDAQYVATDDHPRAIPQRRRRLWLVAYRGDDWRIPARIVFEFKKDLTEEPPVRICGKGFKELNPDFDETSEVNRGTQKTKKSKKVDNQDMFAFDVVETDDNKLKVSRIIDFSEMPSESNFAMVSKSDIYSFVSKIGEPGYIGPVFRTDKKKTEAKKKVELDLFAQMNENEEPTPSEDNNTSEDWVGADKISPKILDNIGNAGILANGMIATMTCHEWTSGIQLSPKTYNLYAELVKNHEWLKANDLLPKAYDGTVCGLSDVLEESPAEKYNLSWRACYGILRRADSRAKKLPISLEFALIKTIVSYAGIVKWVALNGRDNKKKDTDMSEREIAMDCFDKYIASVCSFDDIIPTEPSRKNIDDEDGNDDSTVETEIGFDEDYDEGKKVHEAYSVHVKENVAVSASLDVGHDAKCCDTKRDMSRCEVEVVPTLLATAYKEPPAVIK